MAVLGKAAEDARNTAKGIRGGVEDARKAVKDAHIRKSERTKATLLAAARKCIGRYGYSGASVSKIAAEAHVSKGVVYYHFASKEDIATQVLLAAGDELFDTLNADVGASSCAVEALNKMLDSFSRYLFDNKDLSRFMLSELWRSERAWSEENDRRQEALIRLISSQLERGIQEGTMNADMEPGMVAVSIVGTILAVSQYFLRDEKRGGRVVFVRQLREFLAPTLRAVS